MNTPFRDAGVPASKETRRIYGTTAGGRRMYCAKVIGMTEHIFGSTYLSTLARPSIRF